MIGICLICTEINFLSGSWFILHATGLSNRGYVMIPMEL